MTGITPGENSSGMVAAVETIVLLTSVDAAGNAAPKEAGGRMVSGLRDREGLSKDEDVDAKDKSEETDKNDEINDKDE